MTQETVTLSITMESLVKAISSLSLEDKQKLWELLESEIAQGEEPQLESPPKKIVNHNPDYQPTGEILTIAEIRSRYPREWVLIADTESDEHWNVIRGEVLVHSPDRDFVDKSLADFDHITSIAIEYTGPLPEDDAVLL